MQVVTDANEIRELEKEIEGKEIEALKEKYRLIAETGNFRLLKCFTEIIKGITYG